MQRLVVRRVEEGGSCGRPEYLYSRGSTKSQIQTSSICSFYAAHTQLIPVRTPHTRIHIHHPCYADSVISDSIANSPRTSAKVAHEELLFEALELDLLCRLPRFPLPPFFAGDGEPSFLP